MINIDRLPKRLQNLIRAGYFIWVLGVASLALALVIFSAFNIYDVEVNTETAILVGVAILAPIVPFAQRIALPGGGTLSFPEHPGELAATLEAGTAFGEIAIEEWPLDEIILGDL